MNSLPCDIVLLPSKKLAQQATATSQTLEQHGTLFTLEEGKYYPHVSLYMTQLKVADLAIITTLLAQIASQTTVFNLTATRYDQAHGFIDAEYQRNQKIDALQQAVITAINPLRDGMREKDKARMLEATGLALENFRRYGYKYVGDFFRPHMSLTKFSNQLSFDTTQLPPVSYFSGTFDSLGLFEMGNHGTCIRKLMEFTLRASEID